jgi:hypothetical protein
MYTPDFTSFERNFGSINRDFYSGPTFDTVDTKLKHSFQDFLSHFGINDELSVFIESYC